MARIGRFTMFAWALMPLLDTGQALDIDETHRRVADGSILEWLSNTYAGRIGDLSYYTHDSDFARQNRSELLETLANLENAVDERRKFGVERNGLVLLLAYVVQACQHEDEFG